MLWALCTAHALGEVAGESLKGDTPCAWLSWAWVVGQVGEYPSTVDGMPPSFQPVPRQSLSDGVFTELRGAVLAGRFVPGDSVAARA